MRNCSRVVGNRIHGPCNLSHILRDASQYAGTLSPSAKNAA
jgi:hypothetical protein